MKNLIHCSKEILLNNRTINFHIVEFDQNSNSTLLISKLSEAIKPNQSKNEIGEGSTIDNVFNHQKNIQFIINAGFSHYKKDFYEWNHSNYEIGDPVGLIKIRQHIYNDIIDNEHYGFFVQKDKKSLWTIKSKISNINNYKYILGCTPLLIHHKLPLEIPNVEPVKQGKVNPPSYLGHGNEIHPRTAVGLKDDKIIFLIIENNEYDSGGCTLKELQHIGETLDLYSLLNLDGGGSSQFRLTEKDNTIKNFVHSKDEKRILGHAFIIFDNINSKTDI